MLTDGFVWKVARIPYVPDHLSLIIDHRRIRALFIARPFLIICTKPNCFLVLFMLRDRFGFGL